jgi:hypothetical protein
MSADIEVSLASKASHSNRPVSMVPPGSAYCGDLQPMSEIDSTAAGYMKQLVPARAAAAGIDLDVDVCHGAGFAGPPSRLSRPARLVGG